MTFETVKALRVDPTEFEAVSTDLNDAHTSTTAALDLADVQISAYLEAQRGADSKLIVSSARKTIAAIRSTIAGYPDLAGAFDTAYSTTFGLDTDSNTLWTEVINFVGEMTELDKDGFQGRFDAIRTAEESAMSTLATAIDEAPTGDDIELDPGVSELITRLVKSIDDADTQMDLVVAESLLKDYEEDGDFDISTEEQILLEKGEFSVDEIEKIMADEVDPEVRRAILAEGTFADRPEDEIEGILSGDLDPDLAIDLVEDPRLNYPDEEIMDDVAEAMAEGDHPIVRNSRSDPEHFPPWYVEYFENERKIKAPGTTPLEAAKLEEEQRALREEHNIDSDGKVNQIHATSVTGERLDGHQWEGGRYSEIFQDGEEQEAIAEEINKNSETAVGFFNGLDAEGTAEIPTALAEEPELVEKYSEALGDASRVKGDNGLSFSGAEVINADIPRGPTDLPAEVIFVTGDFDDEFLGSATEASIRKKDSEGGELLGPWSPKSQPLPEALQDRSEVARDNRIEREREELEAIYGTDATNILLGRANENPEAAKIAFDGLGEDVEILIHPEHEFVPDDSPRAEGEDPKYPITQFLGIVGEDEGRAKKIFVAHAESGEGDTPKDFQNPGVASGFGLVMGHHATVTFDDKYIEHHGIEIDGDGNRISQSEFAELGLDGHDWQLWQAQVNEKGGGAGLVFGTDRLIREAIRNDLEDNGKLTEEVEIDGEMVNPYETFGLTLGALERNSTEGAISYAESIDDDAEAQNRLNAALGSTGIVILTVVAAPIVAPLEGAAAVAAVVATTTLSGTDVALSYLGASATEDTENAARLLKKLVIDTSSGKSGPDRVSDIAVEESILIAQTEYEASLEGLHPLDDVPPYPVRDDDGNKVRVHNGVLQTEIAGEWVETRHADLDLSTGEPGGKNATELGDQAEGSLIGDEHTRGFSPSDPGDLQKQLDDAGVDVDVQHGAPKKTEE